MSDALHKLADSMAQFGHTWSFVELQEFARQLRAEAKKVEAEIAKLDKLRLEALESERTSWQRLSEELAAMIAERDTLQAKLKVAKAWLVNIASAECEGDGSKYCFEYEDLIRNDHCLSCKANQALLDVDDSQPKDTP